MPTSPAQDILRSARTRQYELPVFDPDAAPADPVALFIEWLEAAASVVSQPAAVVLATAGEDGAPDARTVLLKDVTADGFWFASLSASPKGRQLAANPRAALVFHWREQGRQVRVTGRVQPGPRSRSDADFTARHPFARAQAIAGEQSEPMPGSDEVARRMADARARIDREPSFAPEAWTAYVVRPLALDFWQATDDHDQVRLAYRNEGGTWSRARLWP